MVRQPQGKEQLLLEEEEEYLVPSLLTSPLDPELQPSPSDLTYYLTFSPFLPDSVFHLLSCRLAAWAGVQAPRCGRRSGSSSPSPSLLTRWLLLELSSSGHSVLVTMQPLRYSRLRVVVQAGGRLPSTQVN